jgi:GH15 family glucan-1,4-alpha-glucosidase
MAWLALDRALRIATTHRTPIRQRRRWSAARDRIGHEVRLHGFDERLGAYTRTYGSADLDAATLVLPLVGLEHPRSPRVHGTIDAIRRELGANGPRGALLFRYPPGRDGLPGGEGAFLPCSCWLVQALAAAGRIDEAAEVFEDLASRAGALGLYPEEIDPRSGEALGNFPQALTHAGLVQAALALRDAQGRSLVDDRGDVDLDEHLLERE